MIELKKEKLNMEENLNLDKKRPATIINLMEDITTKLYSVSDLSSRIYKIVVGITAQQSEAQPSPELCDYQKDSDIDLVNVIKNQICYLEHHNACIKNDLLRIYDVFGVESSGVAQSWRELDVEKDKSVMSSLVDALRVLSRETTTTADISVVINQLAVAIVDDGEGVAVKEEESFQEIDEFNGDVVAVTNFIKAFEKLNHNLTLACDRIGCGGNKLNTVIGLKTEL